MIQALIRSLLYSIHCENPFVRVCGSMHESRIGLVECQQMNIGDYIQSQSNKNLIVNFALKKLSAQFPDQRDTLQAAIELEIDGAIQSAVDAYGFWLVTASNIADANVAIWKTLKPKVERSMGSAVEKPEARLKELLEMRGATVRPKEDPSDEAPAERSMDFLAERYNQSWQ